MTRNSRRTKPPTKDPKGRCGSLAGYQAHGRRGEKPCKLCKAANTTYQRERRAGAGPKYTRPSDVRQDQRRGADGKPVEDSTRPREAAAGVASRAPRRGNSAPAPAPVPAAVSAPPETMAVSQRELDPVEGIPEPPAYLRAQGRALWDQVLQEYELNPAGLVLLGEACRTVDRLERLAAALSSRSTLWFEVEESLESQGMDGAPEFNVVVNGMVGEARQLQAALRSTLKELGITEVVPRAVHTQERESLTDELKRKRQERMARAKEREG